jgi:lysophospholipase L1-like esterase
MVLVPQPGRKHPSVHFTPYTYRLQALIGQKVKVVNAGKSGDTTDDMMVRLPEIQTKPVGLAIIFAGTNDVTPQHVSAENITTNLEKLHSAFWSRGAFSVAITLPALSWIRHLPFSIAKYKAVNEYLREMQRKKGDKVLGLLELENKFLPTNAPENAFFWGIDFAHLSDQGYERVGELVFKVIEASVVDESVSKVFKME